MIFSWEVRPKMHRRQHDLVVSARRRRRSWLASSGDCGRSRNPMPRFVHTMLSMHKGGAMRHRPVCLITGHGADMSPVWI